MITIFTGSPVGLDTIAAYTGENDDFYDDHYDDFYNYDEAEEYWIEHEYDD